jgi:hypothetical protein
LLIGRGETLRLRFAFEPVAAQKILRSGSRIDMRLALTASPSAASFLQSQDKTFVQALSTTMIKRHPTAEHAKRSTRLGKPQRVPRRNCAMPQRASEPSCHRTGSAAIFKRSQLHLCFDTPAVLRCRQHHHPALMVTKQLRNFVSHPRHF